MAVVRLPHPPSLSPARGMALLLVLILSAILLPFAVEFSMQVHLESRTAINVTDQLKIDNEIDGQYEIMLARLRYDLQEGEVDSYSDSWNSEELRERHSETTDVGLTTQVFDEQGKLNVRMAAEGTPERQALYRKRLRNLLALYRRDTPHELSGRDADQWASNMTEYLSKGALRANIPKPRMGDDRAILILDEFNFIPKQGEVTFASLLADQRKDDRTSPGLHRFVTVYGTGKVNLNTADELVLRAFFPENPEMAERIVEYRDSPTEEEEDADPAVVDATASESAEETTAFKDVAEIMKVDGMTPEILELNGVDPALDFDVQSDIFSFRILGETKTTRRDELFVVERVRGESEEEPLQGFRLRLRQERTDPLEAGAEEEEE